MFQFNRSQQNHFCTSMLQLFLMKVGRNASTCCQHPQFLIESVDHRLVTISRFMLTLILQTASNLRLAAIISLQYAYLDLGGGGGALEQLSRGKHNPHNAQIFSMGMQTVFRLFIFSRKKENPQSGLHHPHFSITCNPCDRFQQKSIDNCVIRYLFSKC